MVFKTKPGSPYPHGAKFSKDGVNFSIFSRHAESVELLLYKTEDCKEPFQVITLSKEKHCTFFSWHIFVKFLPAGTWYTWRVDGPNHDPRHTGLCFDKEKHLLDPWARAVSIKNWNRASACFPGDNGDCAMRSVVVDDNYDWEGDTPLAIRSERAIIYEMHVGGFTRHSSSKVKHPGTFSGVIEKIPYLKSLGITHVELLPVMAFDEQDVPEHTADLGLKNYWGYSTHSFFSPHPGFCVTPEQGTHQQEFRDMVKALHQAGIGVILDVVFNHTSESGADGPMINFKGMVGNSFYLIDKVDKTIFHDYTGCGNTVNANHPLVSRFIISCLEYWVRDMHVDGFRFDLASALSRGEDGSVLDDPPIVWGIELSEQLAKTKLIAEAWDATGLYQVGCFPGFRWAEWNGIYRDVVRQYVRGDKDMVKNLATRICGSSDLYEKQQRLPISSINFVTCHDGFTLNDLFSYNEKHNEANGEHNRDGCNHNLSYNHGVEGDTDDPAILALRRRQAKNTFAILLLSQGVPMLLAGDEFLHSQQGNNNCYCQDNELAWLNWEQAEQNQDMVRFVRLMIRLRKRHASLMRRHFFTGKLIEGRDIPDIRWQHTRPDQMPEWDNPDNRFLAFTLGAADPREPDIFIALNMDEHAISVELPVISDHYWCLSVDTARPGEEDIIPRPEQTRYCETSYTIHPHSVVVFENKLIAD
nr:glycogen debranching protein GlgX [methane-oxidizing endosymbiont of Gigantopelta aegis]